MASRTVAARGLCLTGRRIDAIEALRLGLVSEVVHPRYSPNARPMWRRRSLGRRATC